MYNFVKKIPRKFHQGCILCKILWWELGVRENEKGQRKKEENYIKKGGKGLKNASFLDYKLKIIPGNLSSKK